MGPGCEGRSLCHVRGYFKERQTTNTVSGSGLLWVGGKFSVLWAELPPKVTVVII